MKKRTLLFTIFVALICFLFSCSNSHTEHVDNNNDGKCDDCGTAVSQEPTEEPEEPNEPESGAIELIKDGKANFKIVYSSEFSSTLRKAVENIVEDMEKEGIEIIVESDADSDPAECEILIGSVTGRADEYNIDIHTLGEKGYIVKLIGKKVVVLGGSESAQKDAIDAFLKDYLGYKKNKTPKNLTVTAENDIDETQNNYRITAIKINGNDIRGYNIAASSDVEVYSAAALSLQSVLYSKAGYWLPIVDIADATDKSIVISAVEDAGKDGFIIEVRENNLVVECAYHNAFEKCFNDFVAQKISVAEGELNFDSKFKLTEKVSEVRYKDFGAVGDGNTNDFAAIKAAHDYANEGGQKVVAGYGKYLITKTNASTITIKTQTDWSGAEFIIDDSDISLSDSDRSCSIFTISSDYAFKTYSQTQQNSVGKAISALNKNVKNGIVIERESTPLMDLGLGYRALIVVFNSGHKNYIRYGGNANDGNTQREIVLIDENGQVDPSTPFLLDYAKITDIQVCRADLPELTITGGKFTTIANTVSSETYASFARGISITRPNTVISGLEHYITGEGENGVAYGGFISISNTTDVLVKDCILTAHKTYYCEGSGGGRVGMGTYDIGIGTANNVVFKNCTQSNFFYPGTTVSSMTTNSEGWYYWGISGTNYCKNLVYDECTLSRFDAHSGVYNAKIIKSKVSSIAIIGGGTFEMIDSELHSPRYTMTSSAGTNSLIDLRSDYGSTFNGKVIVKNVKMISGASVINVIGATYSNHNFGYGCALPSEIEIDNFSVEGSSATTIYLVSAGFASIGDIRLTNIDGTENNNPTTPPKKVTIKRNGAGYTFAFNGSPFYSDTEIIIVKDDE